MADIIKYPAEVSMSPEFLEKVKTGVSFPDNEKERTCGALVEAVRKDLLARRVVKRSKLNAKDFRHFVST